MNLHPACRLVCAFAIPMLFAACGGGSVSGASAGTGQAGGDDASGSSTGATTGNPNIVISSVVTDANISTSLPAPITDNGGTLVSQGSTDFGPNVLIFAPSMAASAIQAQVDAVFKTQQTNQFGTQRYALFFKPGAYDANVQVGFYTTVHGLGAVPDAVTITGGVNTLAAWNAGNATTNFWRGVENMSIVPTQYGNNEMWAVSQATHMRRVHVKGTLQLYDFLYYPGGVNWSSGGFIADSIIDSQVVSGSQQQFLTRNTTLSLWSGDVWNMVFVGDNNAPSGTWPTDKYTVVPSTPFVREKPYLTVDNANNYSVVVPALKRDSTGPSFNTTQNLTAATALPLSKFYVAQASRDTATSMNIALQRGYNLLLTPGVYSLSAPLVIRNPNTVVLGLGIATLTPTQNTPALMVADVDGVTVAGLLLDAGAQGAPNLLQLGDVNASGVDHSSNPTAVFDVSCRVGGAALGAHATSCMVVNSRQVILDNVWLWRADHGSQAGYTGWTVNAATHGLVVNSDDVVAYGLFVEHFEGYQTLWNGNGGRVFFYQSEIPYDVPNQSAWTHDGENGFASYKVASTVTSHSAMGLGVYCNFYNAVQLDNAIETPSTQNITVQHIITEWLGVATGSAINHIINNTGAAVSSYGAGMQATSSN